jgi:hypothetical protein
MTSLPGDIQELVVDHWRTDKPTLFNCATVSHAMSRRAQFHLFRTVIIRNENRYRSFLYIAEGSPCIQRAVRRLWISSSSPPSSSLSHTSWFEEAIFMLDKLLTEVHALRTQHSSEALLDVEWNQQKLSDLLASSFTQVTELVITDTRFSNIHEIVRCVTSRPNLSHLALSQVHPGATPPADEQLIIPHLDYLELDFASCGDPVLQHLINGNLSKLGVRVMRLDNVLKRINAIENALKILGPLKLQHLRIHAGDISATDLYCA